MLKERLPSAAGLAGEKARLAGQPEAAPPWREARSARLMDTPIPGKNPLAKSRSYG